MHSMHKNAKLNRTIFEAAMAYLSFHSANSKRRSPRCGKKVKYIARGFT